MITVVFSMGNGILMDFPRSFYGPKPHAATLIILFNLLNINSSLNKNKANDSKLNASKILLMHWLLFFIFGSLLLKISSCCITDQTCTNLSQRSVLIFQVFSSLYLRFVI